MHNTLSHLLFLDIQPLLLPEPPTTNKSHLYTSSHHHISSVATSYQNPFHISTPLLYKDPKSRYQSPSYSPLSPRPHSALIFYNRLHSPFMFHITKQEVSTIQLPPADRIHAILSISSMLLIVTKDLIRCLVFLVVSVIMPKHALPFQQH
jgi:hypothetical protein